MPGEVMSEIRVFIDLVQSSNDRKLPSTLVWPIFPYKLHAFSL